MRSLSLPQVLYAIQDNGYIKIYMHPELWELDRQKAIQESDPSKPMSKQFFKGRIEWEAQ
jgi:hypothetical protein